MVTPDHLTRVATRLCCCSVCPEVGRPLGVTDVASDVVALVSHATQECLHGLILKLTVLAGHRTAAVKVQQEQRGSVVTGRDRHFWHANLVLNS